MGFNFTLDYRSGKTNIAAVALSRDFEDHASNKGEQPHVQSLMAASALISKILEALRWDTATLPDLIKLRQQWEDGSLS